MRGCTWFVEAWRVRQRKVRAQRRKGFEAFLKMPSLYKWVDEAKREYLEKERRGM